MWLIELLGAIFLWRWADQQDAAAADEDFAKAMAFASAPDGAARWNRWTEEHSHVDGPAKIDVSEDSDA